MLPSCMQQVGGALFVDVGSSLDVMNEITFESNSLAIVYDLGIWVRKRENEGGRTRERHRETETFQERGASVV